MKDQHFSSELPNHCTQFSDDEYRSEKGVKLVKLSANSSEHQNVIAQLIGSIPIVKAIHRVQNPLLYLAHQFYKFKLQKKYPEMPISEMERKLFHGTNSAHKTAIAQQGFDFRMNGKNGTSMGKGSYFVVVVVVVVAFILSMTGRLKETKEPLAAKLPRNVFVFTVSVRARRKSWLVLASCSGL
jgi:hypothetical protein